MLTEREESVSKENKFNNLSSEWREIPPNFVSVYHNTVESALLEIDRNGLKYFEKFVLTEKQTKYQKIKIELDKIFDKVASDLGLPFRRHGSVFVSPDVVTPKQTMGKGGIFLELKVDPQNVVVGDGRLVMAAGLSWFRTPEMVDWLKNNPDFFNNDDERVNFFEKQKEFNKSYEDYIKEYWQTAITLEGWNALSEDEKKKRFPMSEAIVTGDIPPSI